MPRFLHYLFCGLLLTLLVGAPWAYASCQHYHFRRFCVVDEGILYRSGQLTPTGLKRVVHDHGIKTVITLRSAGEPNRPTLDNAEVQFCQKYHLDHHRIAIPQRSWLATSGTAPIDKGMEKFCEIMDNPENHPVLIHCYGGIHRTGVFCALYRLEYNRWSRDEALAEMQALGYDNIDELLEIMTYLDRYTPRWKGKPSGPTRAERDLVPLFR